MADAPLSIGYQRNWKSRIGIGFGGCVERRFLSKALRMHYCDPGLALWRGVELDALSRVALSFPLLDLGCGNGLFSLMLLAPSIEETFDDYTFHYLDHQPSDAPGNSERVIIGLDIDYTALEHSKRLPHYSGVMNGDARGLPFANESFASVISNCALEHVDGIDLVLKEVARVLRSGGTLSFTVPSTSFGEHLLGSAILGITGGEILTKKYIKRVNDRLVHRNVFSADEWSLRLERAGLRMVDSFLCLPPITELAWGVFRSLGEIGVGRFNVCAALGRTSAMLASRDALFFKRAWCSLLEWLVGRVYLTASVQGAALMVVAKKEG